MGRETLRRVSMLGGAFQRFVAMAVLASLAVTGMWSLTAGGDQVGTGVITGRVIECDPAPVVVVPGFPAPSPTPSSVILIHHHVAYATQAISFSAKEPWEGDFSFTVPPGHYEIVSTYQGYIHWVVVRPGSSTDVTLGTAICPE
jgi:hypothetical protein